MNLYKIKKTADGEQLLPLDRLLPYSDHPFLVKQDEKLQALSEDIKANGLIHAIIVRSYDFDGRYEILSGHRRVEAHRLAGLEQIKAVIVKATDEQASRIVVQSNFLQRDKILPSERARSYQLRNEQLKAIKNVQKNTADPHGIEENKINSHGENNACSDMEKEIWLILSKEFGDSVSSIYRYIRLNFLVPDLLEIVDANRMRLLTAVELSYLSEEYQRMIYRYFYSENRAALTPELLPEIKENAGQDTLNENRLNQIVSKGKLLKKCSGSLTLKKKFVKKYEQYFDDKTQLLKTIEELLDGYVKQKNKE